MVDQPLRVVAAACDGACSGNPGPGGWGALLRFEDGSQRELGGADPATTNNRMELTAALALLEILRDLPRHPKLVIHTDSRYLIDGLQKWLPGWKRKGWRTASGGQVLNRDLWERLDRARLSDLSLVHVRGHSGDPDNDRCDAIAVAFSRGQRPALARESPAAAARAPKGAQALTAEAPGLQTSIVEIVAATAGSGPSLAGAAAGVASRGRPAASQASAGSNATPTQNGPTKPGATKDQDLAAAVVDGGLRQPSDPQSAAGDQPAGDYSPADPAPEPLVRLLSRLELAERLAAGGFALSLVELAQLVELPLRSLESRQQAWTWRDWTVVPLGQGRWRLERDAGGLASRQ
jgi:ribonuclease HI